MGAQSSIGITELRSYGRPGLAQPFRGFSRREAFPVAEVDCKPLASCEDVAAGLVQVEHPHAALSLYASQFRIQLHGPCPRCPVVGLCFLKDLGNLLAISICAILPTDKYVEFHGIEPLAHGVEVHPQLGNELGDCLWINLSFRVDHDSTLGEPLTAREKGRRIG